MKYDYKGAKSNDLYSKSDITDMSINELKTKIDSLNEINRELKDSTVKYFQNYTIIELIDMYKYENRSKIRSYAIKKRIYTDRDDCYFRPSLIELITINIPNVKKREREDNINYLRRYGVSYSDDMSDKELNSLVYKQNKIKYLLNNTTRFTADDLRYKSIEELEQYIEEESSKIYEAKEKKRQRKKAQEEYRESDEYREVLKRFIKNIEDQRAKGIRVDYKEHLEYEHALLKLYPSRYARPSEGN